MSGNGRCPSAADRGRERFEATAGRVVIWYLRLAALLDLAAAVSVPLRNRVRHANSGNFYTPFLVTASFTSAAFALFLAVMLARRKRVAWMVTTVLMVPLSTLYVWLLFYGEFARHPLNWASCAVSVAVSAALLYSRREFSAKGEHGNVRLAGLVLLGGGALGVLLASTLVSVTDKIASSSLGDRVEYAVYRVFTLAPDRDFDVVEVPRWVDVIINGTALVIFLLVLYALFRAPKGRELLTGDDELRLRALLERQGERDSLGYFALRRDKAVVWSPTGKAAVAYRVVGGVTLASGDPIGDPEAWPGAIEQWLDQARRNAWVPAVMGASEEGGTVYARHGLDALELGDEAIVEIADFTLEGRAMRVVRQAYNRVKRAGYSTRVRRHGDIPEDEMRELVELADHWRDGETERGFSMALGRLGDPDDDRCVMVECVDADGKLRALLSFVPWGAKGLSLDLMRRDRDSENGLLEFIILDLIATAGAHGVERLSLNFAMFRSVFERGSRLGAGPVLRLWRAVLLFFSRWWQIESLYRSNAKYRPIWEPRYLCFRKASELPRIGLASARAEGFVTAPSLPALFGRRHVQQLPPNSCRPATPEPSAERVGASCATSPDSPVRKRTPATEPDRESAGTDGARRSRSGADGMPPPPDRTRAGASRK